MSTESTERIETIAGDWLARRDAQNWSDEEQAVFDAWINESTLHRVAYLRVENAWEEALRLKALAAGIASEKPPPPGQWMHSPFFTQRAEATHRDSRKSRRWGRALAASLLLAVAVSSAWYLWPSGSKYVTSVGGIASLPMSDGSKVILNTDSEIKVAMDEKERRIELAHGEAFFDVAKDAARPFIVSVGDKRVIAIGTQFSVRRVREKSDEEIQVVVTEGAVRVESSEPPRIITAGGVARANKAGVMVQTKKLPEAEEQLAWRSGSLVLRDVSLADAVAEFNRYNERKIVIEDPAAAAFTVGGTFRTTNVDAFVRLLEQGYPLRADFQRERIVLSSR